LWKLLKKKHHPYETPEWEAYQLEPVPVEGSGQGRLLTLTEKTTLSNLVERVKKHLKLSHVRVATAAGKNKDNLQVQTIALCAGAGDTVISKVKADVYLTGEMRHHDIIAAVEQGTSVILCDHSNTERGFLTKLKSNLDVLFQNQVVIEISQRDADPLVIV